ncbi:HAMP domain-containing protein [Paractinoplanes hotanensis]|uniref:histidine kinase n=1 Tax=Paractinoplanes hotanensis TaxID=2906497 RepID=A0ABT0Y048_9ACTN|nr:HAMP domain-containing protein [Actinoplanes hotanensis]MCM4079417.1 HAMP domain-containing protein [Actinoplanes hotanensis]
MTTVDTRVASPSGPETSVLSTDQLIAWRWRALSQQLPESGFPAGSHAPALVYLWTTMVIALATVLGFAVSDREDVPAAVRESQQDLMRKVAHSLALSVTAADDAFDQTAAALLAGAPVAAATIAGLTGEEASWAGVAVIQPSTRKVIAASAEPIPLNLIPNGLLPVGDTPVMTVEGPAVIRAQILGEDRMLVGVQRLLMRSLRLNADAQQGLYVLTPNGQNYLVQGVDAIPAEHRGELLRDLPGLGSSRSETIRIKEWSGRALVVSAAPVAETGFVVASAVVAAVTAGPSLFTGLVLGLAVTLTAIAAYVLMRAFLVAPLQHLLYQAKLDASGALTRTRRILRTQEAYRVAQALAVASGHRIHGRRWRPTVRQGLTLAALVAVIGPALAVTVAVVTPSATLPVQLNRDEESRVEAISNTLGNALDSGLRTVARLAPAPSLGRSQLDEALAANHRLRGVYLVEPDGSVTASAGRESLRSRQALPGRSGVLLDPEVDRLPVVYAYQVRTDGRAVVAEYDIDYLLGLVRSSDGRAVVADPGLRTILDSEGYRAFQPLRDTTMRTVAATALPGVTNSRAQDLDGRPALVAGAAITHPTAAHLEWVVVTDRKADTLPLPSLIERRWALLMVAAVVAVLVVALIWQFFIFVRPLRRLADAADRIGAGDFDEPIIPQRHDDVGAIAMCLEICRQVRHTGSARFGGAVRLRGSAANFTAVLPRPRRAKRES